MLRGILRVVTQETEYAAKAIDILVLGTDYTLNVILAC